MSVFDLLFIFNYYSKFNGLLHFKTLGAEKKLSRLE